MITARFRLLCGALLVAAIGTHAGDWPMWRYDANRSASAPHPLPDELHLQWTRELPPPRRAWPPQADDADMLAFDRSYQPVVADGRLLVPSMVTDSVTAYDVKTGDELWRYHTDGPVRFAPAVWEDRVFVAADDGYLHCLDLTTGERLWAHRAVPADRLVLGNERIINLWPVRGAPVVKDGVVYFAAGLWPHEGVYIYALDARTAEILWVNSASESEWVVDSKRYFSFGGVAPQGQLVIHGERLLVPGGRTAPAVFERDTGRKLYCNAVTPGRSPGGGHAVFAQGDVFFNKRRLSRVNMYDLVDGAHYRAYNIHVVSPEQFFAVSNGRVLAYAPGPEQREGVTPPAPEVDRLGRRVDDEPVRASGRAPSSVVTERLRWWRLSRYYELPERWESDSFGLRRLHARAGDTLYGSGPDGRIIAVELLPDGSGAELKWTHQVEGEVFTMVPAQERLFVVTEEGTVYCFGPEEVADPALHHRVKTEIVPPAAEWTARARSILRDLDPRAGYALVFGVGSGALLDALLNESDLHFTVYDPDPGKVAELRDTYMAAGWYGRRVVAHQGDLRSVPLPPYMASLTVSEDPVAVGLSTGDLAAVRALYHVMRPHGGQAAIWLDPAGQNPFMSAVTRAELAGLEWEQDGDLIQLQRVGAPAGAGTWTHQNADEGNTAFAPDPNVRAPLGVAWFGGEPNDKTLPRHMFGPNPQVVAGRLIILGPHHVSARCAYTGIELWATELPRVGASFTSYEHV